jgi:nucleoside 2-deoxyribosyltransferase
MKKPKEDILDHPDVKRMLNQFRDSVLPNIKGSNTVGCIISGKDPDPKMCFEMGAALLLDKPILAICFDRAYVSRHLLRIAAEIVEVTDLKNPADTQRVTDAIQRVNEGMA